MFAYLENLKIKRKASFTLGNPPAGKSLIEVVPQHLLPVNKRKRKIQIKYLFKIRFICELSSN
jgi:hypothetical protein